VVPYYNKPTQEGLYRHFKTVANSTKLPCILYNVPSRTVTSLSTEITIRLSQVPNIVGTKEASGKLEKISRIVQGTDDSFTVWSGNDADTLPIMALGGYGVISVASHFVGKQIGDMMEYFANRELKNAARLHANLLPLFDALFVIANPVPVKYALNQLGFRVGPPRPPLYEPDEKTATWIMDEVKKHRLDLKSID
jgi:4-hydroxy-tetrahydrodipicolinate synthase